MNVPLVARILRVQVSSAFHVKFLKSGESKSCPEMALLVHRDERHALLRNVVHVSKGEHS